MDMSQYLEIFIEESKEHLDHMNQILLDLENNTEDLALLNEIFRIAHTIKGMSGTMGFTKVADLTHEMENVLDLVRSKQIPVTGKIVDILFECFDTLEIYIDHLAATGEEGDHNSIALVNKLKKIVEHKSLDAEDIAPVAPTQAPTPTPAAVDNASNEFKLLNSQIPTAVIHKAHDSSLNVIKLKIILDDNVMLKAARAFIIFTTLEQYGEIIMSFPNSEEIEDEQFDDRFEVIYVTKLDAETSKNEVMKVSEIKEVIAEMVPLGEDIPRETIVTATSKKEDEPKQTAAVAKAAAKTEETASKAKSKAAKTVRVDINRLDNLMNLVSELIIIKTRLEDKDNAANKQNVNDAIEYLERITNSLHDAVMKVRMVPVERTFNRFPRMVRDTAKDLGKNIKLVMSGEETEVDRTVIDEIGDPLIHLIRNSIDHGIETPEERVGSGKADVGTVNLRAYPDGNTVVIEVEDDGAGINADRIGQKAVEKGLVSEADLENMKDYDKINYLFKPGFSTAEQITDISGRGVGLDVVKTKIESLNGTVDVESELGKGSKFIIRLPLTLAIIQALMVMLGEERYALPLNNIKEITTIKASTISMVQDQEVVLYRNKTLPLLRLGEILEVPHQDEREDLVTVIVRKGNQEVGLIVDELVGQQEIVIKSLGKYLTGIKAIAGATILGNGSVALIVDPNQLF